MSAPGITDTTLVVFVMVVANLNTLRKVMCTNLFDFQIEETDCLAWGWYAGPWQGVICCHGGTQLI